MLVIFPKCVEFSVKLITELPHYGASLSALIFPKVVLICATLVKTNQDERAVDAFRIDRLSKFSELESK